MNEPTGFMVLIVGALYRGVLRRKIKELVWSAGLDMETEEDKGLLTSVMRIKLTGDAQAINDCLDTIKGWKS